MQFRRGLSLFLSFFRHRQPQKPEASLSPAVRTLRYRKPRYLFQMPPALLLCRFLLGRMLWINIRADTSRRTATHLSSVGSTGGQGPRKTATSGPTTALKRACYPSMTALMRFSGKHVVVTGAASGL